MIRTRALIFTNLLAVLILLAALAVGWREAALFGLAVLATMDLIVLIRERLGRHNPPMVLGGRKDEDHDDTQTSP